MRMTHDVWTYDFERQETLQKPQDWNFCRYCGKPIADTHNVPVCDNDYPQYQYEEKELYIHGRDRSSLQAKFDPQTGIEGPETFHPDGWKYLDQAGGKQIVRDFV